MPADRQRHAPSVACWSAIALGFSIPFTIALNSIFLATTLAAWLLSFRASVRFGGFRHPLARIALLLFGLLSLGTLQSDPTHEAAIVHLRKYLDLLYIPVFIFLFQDSKMRWRGIQGVAFSLVLVLVLSYLVKFGLTQGLPSFQNNPEYPVVFKERVTHNILMAYAVYLFAWLALSAPSQRLAWSWAIMALLASVNIVAMVPGATGYVILAVLVLFLAYRNLRWRGIIMASIALFFSIAVLIAVSNPFQQRIDRIAHEVKAWRVDQPAQSSPALRLEFYRTTLSIIADHPVIGVGTGGFAQAYAEKVKDTGRTQTQNPHNEFLLMWAQLGIAGLIALVWLFCRQWRLAAHLPTRLERELAYGLIITMVIGCMLNSLLLDHTEGLFYAWLTGVLYGGLKSRRGDPESASAAPRDTSSV
jgi:O-antigen ligase